MNPFSLEGKNILITGASSGIGRQCAISCSNMGGRCILIARNKERLNETLQLMTGNNHLIYTYDLTNFDGYGQLINNIISKTGKLDGAIYSAGISSTTPLKLVNYDNLLKYSHTNVFSGILLSREICKMGNISKTGGSIVFISSVMGVVGDSGKTMYALTKGALLSGVKSLACEFSRKNIRFNAISPGVIKTPINMNQEYMKDPDMQKAVEDKHLLGFGEPIDVANAAIYLLSNAAKWVTGQNLIVDGGYTAK